MYKNNNSVDTLLEKEKIELEINKKDNYLEFNLSKDIDIITPGLSLILGSDYKPHVKRVIYNE
jgi:hypothetical protein